MNRVIFAVVAALASAKHRIRRTVRRWISADIRSSVLDRPTVVRSRRKRAARERLSGLTVHRARKTRS